MKRERGGEMEPKNRSKGEIMMLRRQAQEERRMVYERVKMDDKKTFANASWQQKTVRTPSPAAPFLLLCRPVALSPSCSLGLSPSRSLSLSLSLSLSRARSLSRSLVLSVSVAWASLSPSSL